MNLRQYQKEAVEAVYQHLRESDTNPCVVAPTASGKSLMIGQIVVDAVTRWEGRVLVLAHSKELLEQNAKKVKALCPSVDVGIYSAGLNERSTENACVVAGIQSVYNKAELLGRFDLVLVDEAHMIPMSGDGMYRTFLDKAKEINPLLRVVGFTATPYRLSGGEICRPEHFINEVCYNITIEYLLDHKFISPIVSYEGEAEADLEGLHIRAGDFVRSEIELAMNSPDLVEKACAEIALKTQHRKSVIVFGASLAHCDRIAQCLSRLTGEACEVVSEATTAKDRASILARFKGEESPPLKFLVNMGVLTTGFDAPAIDCVVLLRPTASAALYVQMVGRGFRLAEGKENCLILDYGGNVLRHGPVNDVRVIDRGLAGAKKLRPRVCPECRAHISRAAKECPHCGYVIPHEERAIKHDFASSIEDILGQRDKTEVVYSVRAMDLFVHKKREATEDTPPSVRVELFVVGKDAPIKLWKAPQSSSQWAKNNFRNWWRRLAKDAHANPPHTAAEAVARADNGELRELETITIQYKRGSNFGEDVGYTFREYVEPPFDDFNDDLPF